MKLAMMTTAIPCGLRARVAAMLFVATSLVLLAQNNAASTDEPRIYDESSIGEAQAAALNAHLPLAWVAGVPGWFDIPNAEPGSSKEVTTMTVQYLRKRAIVIYVDKPVDLQKSLPRLYNAFGTLFGCPTVVICAADTGKIYKQITTDQIKQDREKALADGLASVPGYPVAMLKPDPPAPVAPVAVPPAHIAPALVAAPDTNTAAAAVPKPWTPPDVMPAQPNWTWTTTDGRTYQNVVVTKMEADTVTITHSLGVAHIPVFFLTPELKKQLNYP